jgi:hypothetical protein
MASISYAVIALRLNDVDTVEAELREQKMNTLADWLAANKGALYGKTREDWNPFLQGGSIREFLKTEPQIYRSATALIDDEIDDDASDVTVLIDNPIDLYIIDVFALFLKKYQNLAIRLDQAVAVKDGKCCVVLPYQISKEFQQTHDLLIASYSKSWKAVYKAYSQNGSLSRVVVVPDDLRNFRQHLITRYPDDEPDPGTFQKLNRVFGEVRFTEPPRPTT